MNFEERAKEKEGGCMKDNIDRLLEYINSQSNPRAFAAVLLALAAPDPVTAGLVIGTQLAEVNP